MSLDMSLVFKLNSVKDLGNLYEALKQTVTLNAKIKLENDIKRLMMKKTVLEVEIEALTMEKQGMRPPTADEKDKIVMKILQNAEETDEETTEESADEPHPEPSADEEDEEHSERLSLISLSTEPIEETRENAETGPEAPG